MTILLTKEGIEPSTSFRTTDFESAASASSATKPLREIPLPKVNHQYQQ